MHTGTAPMTGPTTSALIHDLVAAAALRAPDRAALIAPDGTAVSFAQFDAQVRAIASWITARSRPGDRIAVLADNGADYARLYYAVPRSGRILTLINQRLSVARAHRPATPGRTRAGARRRPVPANRCAVSPVRWCPSTIPNGSRIPIPSRMSLWRPTIRRGCCSPADRPAPPRACCTPTAPSPPRCAAPSPAGAVRSGGVYLLPFPMCHIAGYNMLVHHSVGLHGAAGAGLPGRRVRRRGQCARGDVVLAGADDAAQPAGPSGGRPARPCPPWRDIAYGSAAIPGRPAAPGRRSTRRRIPPGLRNDRNRRQHHLSRPGRPPQR